MTEAEWLACDWPQEMLEFLRGQTSTRKLRLFAVACCRHILDILKRDTCQAAIEVAERFADQVATAEEMAAALNAAFIYDPRRDLQGSVVMGAACSEDHYLPWAAGPPNPSVSHPATWTAERAAGLRGMYAYEVARGRGHDQDRICDKAYRAEGRSQAETLRCICGPHPFRELQMNPSWTSELVIDLAALAYQNRAFDRLPILADALEDAGCTNRDILDHCRQPGEHVRGCWVVDLVLGKS